MDAVGLWLKSRKEKYFSTDTIIDLADLVLKNNIFTFGKKILKQKPGNAIGTKFAPPYSTLFMEEFYRCNKRI